MVQLARTHKSLKLAEYSKSATAGAATAAVPQSCWWRRRLRLAFLLVAGSGLFLASLRQLQTVDPGFKSDSVLTGKVTLDATNYKDQDLKAGELYSRCDGTIECAAWCRCGWLRFFRRRLRAAMHPSGSFRIVEKPTGPNDPGPHGDKGWATPGYLAAMQIPLLQGRWFSEEDRKDSPPVAVIDDMLAKAYWPGGARWEGICGWVGRTRRRWRLWA